MIVALRALFWDIWIAFMIAMPVWMLKRRPVEFVRLYVRLLVGLYLLFTLYMAVTVVFH